MQTFVYFCVYNTLQEHQRIRAAGVRAGVAPLDPPLLHHISFLFKMQGCEADFEISGVGTRSGAGGAHGPVQSNFSSA